MLMSILFSDQELITRWPSVGGIEGSNRSFLPEDFEICLLTGYPTDTLERAVTMLAGIGKLRLALLACYGIAYASGCR
jgi:hypothetical protein